MKKISFLVGLLAILAMSLQAQDRITGKNFASRSQVIA